MVLGLLPRPGRISAVHRASVGFIRVHRASRCGFHADSRNRVSNFWIPTGGISKKAVEGEKEDANDLLVRGGFLRQAYSGVFHMLPLGLRVQEKLERLIDKHMRSIGASKVSLSSLSSQELWEQSGRFKEGSEVFTFLDRKESKFLLAPTHEEEITALVGSLTKSYKDLPLRVYQISRKYRDEPRPRQGLLRGREFIMKDLYTFDATVEEALTTYKDVKTAYTSLFNELKIPYLVAAADSGNMGGNLSHEFHFPSEKGEDTVVSCEACGHVYNDELADGKVHGAVPPAQAQQAGFATEDTATQGGAPTISTDAWLAISKDKRTLLRAWYPKFSMQDESKPQEREVNSHAVKAIASAANMDLDLGVENPLEQWITHINSSQQQRPQLLDLYDANVRVYQRPPINSLLNGTTLTPNDIDYAMLDRFPDTSTSPSDSHALNIIKVHSGDTCLKCATGVVKTNTAVELGHTFHLGTRYSDVLDASVMIDKTSLKDSNTTTAPMTKDGLVPMQMGCHGIGISRMITAVADRLADSRGLNWPRVMAPYEVIVVPTKGLEHEAERIYDLLSSSSGSGSVEVILDDRDKQIGWKLGDADLIGYPVIVVIGKGWKKQGTVEVQCRRLDGLKEEVPLEGVGGFVRGLLERL